MDSPLSPAQEAALKRAYDLLSEHFHNVLIVTGTRIDPPDDQPANQAHEITRVLNYGSHKEALANAIIAHAHLMRQMQ